MHRAALQREEDSLSLFSLEKLMKLFGSLVCCVLPSRHARALKFAL